jgi:hypothetical protein
VRRLSPALVALVLLVTGPACGKDDVESTRAKQIRTAAEEAGLDDDVIEVLVLASKGPSATYQVTYPGEGTTELVVSQSPGRHRVDVVAAGRIVQSTVIRNGTAYTCAPPKDDPEGALDCDRSSGTVGDSIGVFDDEALDQFTADLGKADDATTISVESREVAGVEVQCIRSHPKTGSPSDGTGPTDETLCLSDEGAPLLVDAGTDRLQASGYSTTVPDGTFDV